jgi:hypothetical protein
MPKATQAETDPRIDGLTYPNLVSDDVFWFVHISDLHIGSGPVAETYLNWVANIVPSAIAPEFIVATGDLTNALLALNRDDEWLRYSTLITNLDFLPLYRDIPGNHDRYGDPGWNGAGAFAGIGGYLNFSASGNLSDPTIPGMFKWTVSTPAGSYLFLAANTNDQFGFPFPLYASNLISDMPDLSLAERHYLEDSLFEFRQSPNSKLAFIFGHHGLHSQQWSPKLPVDKLPGLYDDGTGGDGLVSIVDNYWVSSYLYGHTHDNAETYDLGTVQINTAALEDGNYRIVAVDNGGVSTTRATSASWPVVLITAPVNKILEDDKTLDDEDFTVNPYAHPIPIANEIPVRALVFPGPTACELVEGSVRVYLDGDYAGDMDRLEVPLHNLWETTIDASHLSPRDYPIKVTVSCTNPDIPLVEDIIAVEAQIGPGTLWVSPSTSFSSVGSQGGPFSPTSQVYTLTNTGGTSISYTVSESISWLSLSPESGSLAPGASAPVTLSITSVADSLYPGSYSGTVRFTNVTNGNGNASRPASLTVEVRPVVALTSSPTMIGAGESAALGWASTGVTSCTASGDWDGSREPNGGEVVTPPQTSTYILACEGPGGTASASTTVVVDVPTPGVVLDATPASILVGEATTLSWAASDAASCEASGSGGWAGPRATVGTEQVSPVATTTYTLECTSAHDPNLTVSDTAIVEVASPPSPAPAVTLTALPDSLVAGEQSTLTWAASDADTCSASGAWSGSLATSGTLAVTPLGTSTYGITCNGAGGSTSDQVTIVVNAGPPTGSMSVDPAACPGCRSALIPPGESATLSWEFQNATSCEASMGWSGPRPTSGSEIVSPASSTSYQLGCSGPGGTYFTSVQVGVGLGEPTQITASDYEFADRVEIHWNPVWGATEYLIGRSESWAPARCGGTVIGSTDATVYDDWTAVPGTTYYYWIQATNGSIFSVWNGPDLGRAGDPPPTPEPDPPPAPTNVVATDGLFSDRIQVTWNVVESATDYEVWKIDPVAGGSSVLVATLPGTLFDDFAVSTGQPYGYQVRAIASSGTSDLSLRDDGYLEMPETLGDATQIAATDETYDDRIQLTWNTMSSATGYWIARDTVWHCAACGGPTIAIVAGPPFDDFDVDPLVEYYYWVRPTDGTSLGPWNGPDIGVRWGPPTPELNAPTQIDATAQLSENRIQVTWNAVSGATSYEIARATEWNCAVCGGPIIGSATESPFYDYTAEVGQNYYYWVRATDGSTVSDWNGPDIGAFPYSPPGEPTQITASDGTHSDRVTITWSPASNAAFYEVSRSPGPALAECGGGDMLGSTTTEQFEDSSVSPGATYYYWVRSGDGTTYSNWNGPDAGSTRLSQCSDGLDNDGDMFIDYPNDPGCRNAGWDIEDPQCQDGFNNDFAQDPDPGLIDFDGGQSIHGYCSGGTCPPGVSDPEGDGTANPDPQCVDRPWRDRESQSSSVCGVSVELILLLLPLMWLYRRRRRAKL